MKILKFGAPWCGPCRIQDKILDELQSEGYDVEKINVDEHEELAEKHDVMSVPTILILDGETEVKRFTGLTQKNTIVDVLNNL